VRRDPVPGDLDAPGEPHKVVALGVVEEAFEGGGAARPPGEPRVYY